VKQGLWRALPLSLLAFSVPVVGAFIVPEEYGDYEALLWLVALIPAFLLSYYKAWRGVATSLALGMAVLSVTYAISRAVGRPVPDLLFAVVVFYIVIALMVGWWAERFHSDVRREQVGGAAFTDAATGLPNRKHAELHLEIEFNAAQGGRALSVVMLDLDHFASYNAQHGKIAGDEVLRIVASGLKIITRRMNLSARYGDDEFMCVLGGTDDSGSLVFMNRLHQSLKELSGQRALPSISAGIASYRPGMRSGGDITAAAIEALKRAKKDGPGRTRVHGRVTTPAEDEPVVEEGTSAELRPQMPEGRGSGRKALVVVEEDSVRALLARYLTDHGFKVAQVSNIVDGVQCLSIEYDLLLTDISLSEGIGAELVRAAKVRWPAIQVLGLAHMEGVTAVDALNAGVDRYIEKPLDLPKLRQHLTELLARRDRMIGSLMDNRQLTLDAQAEKAEVVSALKRTEADYRAVVEGLQEIIFRINSIGQFTFLNAAWTAATGYPREDTLGQELTQFVVPEDSAQVEGMLRILMAGDLEQARTELRLIARDGSLRFIELRARRTFSDVDGAADLTGTMHDLTRSRSAEEQLRRTEAESRAILAALPDQVFGLSRSGVFVSHQRTNGDRQGSLIGKTLDEVFPEGIAEAYRAAVERAFATRTVQMCEYQVVSDHGAHQYEARLARVADDEAVAIVRNVSDRKRLEDQLRQSQKLEAIGRLAGGLAHDFNNLLTVVQGNAHLLMEEYADRDDARELAMHINSAAKRGADLVRQLLAFGRRQVLQPRVLDLNTVIASVHALLPRLIGEDVEIRLNLDPEIGLVRADPSQIEQVIVNIGAFAKDRMQMGGVLKISTTNAEPEQDYDPQLLNVTPGPMVCITFEDNGPQLDEETRTHVFEPFYGTIGAGHAGLGLATVYGIVTQSGGGILLDDAPDGGARFKILLPRVAAG
jgi:diguanylate cyclase (GGDEF)-like protein/PAS domain S-box-containing protein